jgi:hypothetical protein
LLGRAGECVLLEFKRFGEVPSLQQLRRHEELRTVFGLRVEWADNYEEACSILDIPTG